MSMWAHFHTEPQDPRLAFRWSFPNGSTSTAYDYNPDAEEMLAWSRWQLGWLDATQVHCMTETENTITLRPVADAGDGIAMVAIPLSDTELIVMESRRKIGYDAGDYQRWPDGARATYPGLLEEGVLVYTVNAKIETGQLPLRVVGDPGTGQVADYPILTQDESVTVRGYTIKVVSSTSFGDTVTITKAEGP